MCFLKIFIYNIKKKFILENIIKQFFQYEDIRLNLEKRSCSYDGKIKRFILSFLLGLSFLKKKFEIGNVSCCICTSPNSKIST